MCETSGSIVKRPVPIGWRALYYEIIPPYGGIFQVFHMSVRTEIIGSVVMLSQSDSLTIRITMCFCAKLVIMVKYRIISYVMSVAGFGKESELGSSPGKMGQATTAR